MFSEVTYSNLGDRGEHISDIISRLETARIVHKHLGRFDNSDILRLAGPATSELTAVHHWTLTKRQPAALEAYYLHVQSIFNPPSSVDVFPHTRR
jgi:hypothetical protein